ncbi:hypothetical protein N0V93_008310 [Gnomoniopsis smithogilvyi]|uniref:DNA replication regulator SLD2 n=1 Tax=Gnomoniopsis smithogilvyi TaxID=1191159 RepID=A0A9W8YMY2_9PEZI|nr:hypothetical protein N0V93_008310 [Gnomoniopsis smithogilvyi]
MDELTRQRYEKQAKDLRVKIKSWEVDFYNSHDGKKPSRSDIKESDMSSTYKEYQRLRDILDGKIPPPASKSKDASNNLRKRKSPQQQPSLTPSTKRFRAVETPSSRRQQPGDSIAMNMFTPSHGSTPSLNRKLFDSPAVPTSIGPTPQRDGRVLGLFDSLPFKDAEIDSPCKPNGAVRLSQVIEAGKEVMAAAATPRKTLGREPGSAASLGRTPSSRHKRQTGATPRKNILSTPLKLDGGNGVAKTPSTSNTVSKLQFQTPAFLRRIPMPKINENSEYTSPEPIRLPRKPLLRGLSSVVADLRKMQEAELDDDLDALREAEMDGPSKPVNRTILSDKTNLPPPPAPSTHTTSIEKQDDASILGEDSEKQALGLLGGFDDEGDYDSAGEQDAGLDRNGNPLRVYKKKGQKRTTRRSNMKPVMTRRPAAVIAKHEDTNNADENIPDAEPNTAAGDAEEDDPALHSGSDFIASDDEDELAQDIGDVRKPTPKTAKAKAKSAAAATAPVKKPARKVNELAHANFKRLKLRNSGAKGGPGHNSRFRRRR